MDISEKCHLLFSIERLSAVLPSLIAETSESSSARDLEGPAKISSIISSIHDIYGEQEDTWSCFLSQFQTFMNAMDMISEVRLQYQVINPSSLSLKITQVNSYAKLAWNILSIIPKVGFLLACLSKLPLVQDSFRPYYHKKVVMTVSYNYAKS